MALIANFLNNCRTNIDRSSVLKRVKAVCFLHLNVTSHCVRWNVQEEWQARRYENEYARESHSAAANSRRKKPDSKPADKQ
jgi:hypothetical protein